MKTLAQTYKKQFGSVEFPFKIYDAKGNGTYWEDSDGYWWRRERDAEGNLTYYENSNGYCKRYGHDAKGNRTYHEDSAGNKSGTPKNSCSGKVVEIDGKKYKLKEIK